MIGGQGEKKTLRMVAQYADESNLVGDNAAIPRKLEVLAEHCERLGSRSFRDHGHQARRWCAVAPTQEELRRRLPGHGRSEGLERRALSR